MGNFTKNTITRGAVVALALSAGAATTANAAVTRVSGSDRYATATKIADSWTTAPTTAVLAAGVGHEVDALTVAPLAKQKNAPIILVDTAATTATIVAQFAKYNTVYIANGTGVVSSSVETALTAAGKTVIRLGGATRYATALNIAKTLGAATDIVIANGDDAHLVDSLSVASIAAAKGMPIFLTSANSLDSAEATYAKGLAAKNVYVLGGATLVSDASVAGLGATVTRLAGAGRYETNAAVVTSFKSALDLSNVYIASGEDENLIDSLVAAPLAGLKNAPIVFAHNSINSAVNTLLGSAIDAKTNIVVLGGTGAVSQAASDAVAKIQDPSAVTTPTGALSVSSTVASTANTVTVTFNQAPADTTKVVFAVANTGTPVVTTATWDATKTIATLTSSSNFPEGTYTVAVKNAAVDLGTQTIQFTSQRIAKISIDSTTLAVVDSGKTGYVGYHVFDQYGADITTSYIAGSGNITWSCGIGTPVSNDKGLLTISQFTGSTTVLTQFQTAVISAVTQNQTIPASASVTLNISTSQGTLSDIKLNKLTSLDSATPTPKVNDGNTYYIDYTALDMSGNATSDLNLVEKGLITTGTPNFAMITSNSQLVSAKIVQNPTDNNKAVIQLTMEVPSYTLMQDQPVTITATTYTGKTSSLTFTVKRATALDSFTMMAPATYVASGETPTIPFVAYDQNGAALTKMGDLDGKVTFSTTDLSFVANADNTASLQWKATTNNTLSPIQQTLTASVKDTGKFSTLNINVQPAVLVNGIQLDSAVVIPRIEVTATENLDFGYNTGGLKVIDQYGRTIDMIGGNKIGNLTYFVQALLPGQDVVKGGAVTGTAASSFTLVNNVAYAGSQIKIKANAAKTDSVNFVVMQTAGDLSSTASAVQIANAIATATSTGYSQLQSFTGVGDGDITGYTLAANANPYFASAPANSSALARGNNQQEDIDFAVELPVYGTMASGSKVFLNDANIVSRTSSSGDFYTLADGYKTKVVANQLAAGSTGSSSTISVTIKNSDDNRLHTATSAVTSSTAGLVAQSMSTYAYAVDRQNATSPTGITVSGNTVTVSLNGTQSYYSSVNSGVFATDAAARSANFNTINPTGSTYSILNGLAGRSLTKFDGIATSPSYTTSHNRAYVYLRAKDQYTSTDMYLSNVAVVESTTITLGDGVTKQALASVAADNTLVFNRMPVIGDYYTISGVSSNGLVQTTKIVFAK